MKREDIKMLTIPNEEAARFFIEIDDAVEAETGQSILGPTKPFLLEVLEDSKDSNIPNAFSALLNSRLKGQLKALPNLKK